MEDFAVGETVRITGTTMTGSVGAVAHVDDKRQKYLVRVSDVTQNYFSADELEHISG
ncbi:hypothetical protein QRX50_25065 [Amycolatopsis carbonis]|uniref:KOW domain-containing protein n=1 Tax=Amycolatopsis carbonis TaxID=715471 RepID=A0A9Y2I898_9PSEU|nr:hypothetical protein [Amycolatopsis sp. 2-15]WIX74852.1 hypothetical protein QRX50_25065 [Amycolatopsis sp. 2-15]